MDIQDTQDKTPTLREDPMARKRAETPQGNLTSMARINPKAQNAGLVPSLNTAGGNFTWIFRMYRITAKT
jgi:hypothetical protein